jgi:serine/threonine-protein kinase
MKLCPKCSEPYAEDAGFCPLDGAELVRSTDPYLGRTLAARYRLIKRLGTGGMSVVYLARHVMIERLSAIKILRQDLGLNPNHRERFLREARAVNRINHRNIVEITDFGEAEGIVYLVMEYVGGEPLLEILKRGAFEWSRAARIAIQIASALARAHQAGVIHRDLKPENVLVVAPPGDGEPIVKLTDFGIAKVVDAPALTFREQLFGTPGYIPPEYLEGMVRADARADLYSLGVMIYEMLTGLLPYDARTQADLLTLPLTQAPVPPSTRVLGFPPDLEALVLRLLARKPEDRPRDAFEVHEALADILRRFAGSPLRSPSVRGGATATRESTSTLVDSPPPAGVEARSRYLSTAEVTKLPTMEIAARYRAMLSEVEAQVDEARRCGAGPAATRAGELLDAARAMVKRLERAKATVSEHQAKVDRLEAHGRMFRGNLGFAIDELVRDRSRERAHLSAIEARREMLHGDTTLGGAQVDPRHAEALVWEMAALEAEEERVRLVEQDLTFQIQTLQTQLDRENECLEAQLVEATGELEGSLSALRTMTGELVRTLANLRASRPGGALCAG